MLNFPHHFPSLGMVYMGGMVYAVGGFNGSLRVRTVDSYDPVKDQWTSVANMQDRRSTLGAAVLNGLLYAVGGFDGSTGISAFIHCLLLFITVNIIVSNLNDS